MCTNCGSSITIPIGTDGDPGFSGHANVPFDGIEEEVIFDTSLNIIVTKDSEPDLPLDQSFSPIGYFIFPGTSNLNGNIPTKAYIIADITGSSWIIRIKNSFGVIIAEGNLITSTTTDLYSLGAISNLPTSLDLFTIEAAFINPSPNTETLNLYSLSLLK